MIALRALVRYVIPLAIATLVVGGPLLYVAFRAPWPRDLASANAALVRAWMIATSGWMLVFVLVAAAAPLVRSLAAGAPLSQARAIHATLANLVRMLMPCIAAIGVVLVGGLALVVPALFLVVALALTGASTEPGMPAPLADSVHAVRAQWRTVALVVGAMFVVDAALVLVTWKTAAVPFAKKLAPAQWATYGNVARITAIGAVATAPVFATLLAAVRARE